MTVLQIIVGVLGVLCLLIVVASIIITKKKR